MSYEGIKNEEETKNVEYFKKCSNYEYKEHITPIITYFKEGKLSSLELSSYLEEVSQYKKVVFVTLLLQIYLTSITESEHFTNYVIKTISFLNEDIFKNDLVFR